MIFDCDGLLVDTETAWTRAERILYARHGVEFTLDHKRELLGTAGPTARAIVERHLGLDGIGARLEQELHALVAIEIELGAPPMPGAPELIAALRAEGVAIGLASNSPAQLVALSLRTAGFDDVFATVVTADQVAAGKPAPDVYLEACRRLDADPRASVALEDSPTGVAAARAAGLHVIGVPSLDGVDLSAAHLVATSLHAAEVRLATGVRLAA